MIIEAVVGPHNFIYYIFFTTNLHQNMDTFLSAEPVSCNSSNPQNLEAQMLEYQNGVYALALGFCDSRPPYPIPSKT